MFYLKTDIKQNSYEYASIQDLMNPSQPTVFISKETTLRLLKDVREIKKCSKA
jgi:hypothetical protein